MKNLQRIAVDKFLIENATELEKLSENHVISVEDLYNDYPQIDLNKRKLELFLNGVMLTNQVKNGIYRIYHEQEFIGLGVVKNELLKRDVVVK